LDPLRVAYNEDGREQAGMGAAAADFNGDGLLDIFKTNFADDNAYDVQESRANLFEDDTIGSGPCSQHKVSGMGTAFSISTMMGGRT